MKEKRQNEILRLIEEYDIGTQEEVALRLREAGYDVTQATVSRDIRELKLSKISIGEGRQKGESMKHMVYGAALLCIMVLVLAGAMIVSGKGGQLHGSFPK